MRGGVILLLLFNGVNSGVWSAVDASAVHMCICASDSWGCAEDAGRSVDPAN